MIIFQLSPYILAIYISMLTSNRVQVNFIGISKDIINDVIWAIELANFVCIHQRIHVYIIMM